MVHGELRGESAFRGQGLAYLHALSGPGGNRHLSEALLLGQMLQRGSMHVCTCLCMCVCEKHLLGPSLHAFTSMCMSVQVCTPAQKAYRQHAATLSEVTAPSHVRVALPVPQLVQGGVVVHGCCLSLLG